VRIRARGATRSGGPVPRRGQPVRRRDENVIVPGGRLQPMVNAILREGSVAIWARRTCCSIVQYRTPGLIRLTRMADFWSSCRH
jgi:hypothetical protein